MPLKVLTKIEVKGSVCACVCVCVSQRGTHWAPVQNMFPCVTQSDGKRDVFWKSFDQSSTFEGSSHHQTHKQGNINLININYNNNKVAEAHAGAPKSNLCRHQTK